MPAVNENDAEHGQAEGIAEEQQQQIADARPGNPRPQRTAQPPAHAARRQPFGQQGEAGGQRYPAKPDQCTQGRAVAVERAPFALQRRRRIGQHADIRYRLVLEAHDDVREPAGGSGGHLAGFGGNLSHGGRSLSRRSCCIGRPSDRNRKRDPRQSDDEIKASAAPQRIARQMLEPQPHAAGLPRETGGILGLSASPVADFLARFEWREGSGRPAARTPIPTSAP